MSQPKCQVCGGAMYVDAKRNDIATQILLVLLFVLGILFTISIVGCVIGVPMVIAAVVLDQRRKSVLVCRDCGAYIETMRRFGYAGQALDSGTRARRRIGAVVIALVAGIFFVPPIIGMFIDGTEPAPEPATPTSAERPLVVPDEPRVPSTSSGARNRDTYTINVSEATKELKEKQAQEAAESATTISSRPPELALAKPTIELGYSFDEVVSLLGEGTLVQAIGEEGSRRIETWEWRLDSATYRITFNNGRVSKVE